jgi:hypothetical protein
MSSNKRSRGREEESIEDSGSSAVSMENDKSKDSPPDDDNNNSSSSSSEDHDDSSSSSSSSHSDAEREEAVQQEAIMKDLPLDQESSHQPAVAAFATRMPPLRPRSGGLLHDFKKSPYPMCDSKQEAMRQRKLYGASQLEKHRAERREERGYLQDPVEGLTPNQLASSSSSESESSRDAVEGQQRWTKETVDFYELERDNPELADKSLFEIIPLPEISRLVGWATHCNHDGEMPSRPPHNPLLSLPNTPLPPSYLNYISNEMRKYLMNQGASDGRPRKKRRTDSEADSETPKPGDTTAGAPQRSSLFGSFDCSALVGMGMVWEEMVTASLLPLARQYVTRCRTLEMISNNDSEEDATEQQWSDLQPDPFREWTLPPEEAVRKMVTDPNFSTSHVNLPSALPPTRTRPQNSEQVRLNLHQMQQLSTQQWCQRHGLDPAFVANNMELFGAFLPCRPDPQASDATVDDAVGEKESKQEDQ